jgi:hypothetical protein
MYVLAIPRFPFRKPQRKRPNMATQKFVARPKILIAMMTPITLRMTERRLP